MSRTAVILFNLGGPDSPEAVRPFLQNMFSDPAILRVPRPVRAFLSRLISSRRAPVAREIYAQLGGASPILKETQAQAQALETALGADHRVFIAMRYWHPRASEVARQVKQYAPERIVLLPLYPQYSTATTASSFAEWHKEAEKAGITAENREICCYFDHPAFIAAHAGLIRRQFEKIPAGAVRVLFSAHGLPEKIIRAGDPYQWQVEQTVAAVVKALALPGLDYVTCYQSRVGRLKWIGPSTEEEIRRAGAEGKAVMVVPVAFVSEHSETLVELDIEYAHLAKEAGVPHFSRVPALGTHPDFIAALAERANNHGKPCLRRCPADFSACPCAAAGSVP